MSTSPVYFSRQPYKVTYFKDGEKQTLQRRPPPLLHQMLPNDVVELTRPKNGDFGVGENFTIKHINPRHPNTIQITNDDGVSTFVDHFDLQLEEMIAPREGAAGEKVREYDSRYLTWP